MCRQRWQDGGEEGEKREGKRREASERQLGNNLDGRASQGPGARRYRYLRDSGGLASAQRCAESKQPVGAPLAATGKLLGH